MNIVSKFAGPVSRSNTVNNSRWQDTTPFLLQVFSLLLILSVNSVAYGQPLSIQFSQKNQLKTGMTWIKFKPKLVLAPSHRAPRKSKFDPVDPVESGDQNGRMPYSAVGKLLFTKDDGKISSCSAAFAGSNDVIVTAAHCVMTSSGDWNENFLFIRAYGSENQDVYAIQCVSVPGRWGELTDANLLPFDYAFLRSTRKSTVGSLGITNGQPPGKLTIVGYSDSHYEGRHLVRLPTDVVLAESGKIGFTGNTFGQGNSGAPWLSLSTIYSISSHFNTSEEDIMWGPRLTDDAMSLINFTRKGCQN